jgi:hypothetical protein
MNKERQELLGECVQFLEEEQEEAQNIANGNSESLTLVEPLQNWVVEVIRSEVGTAAGSAIFELVTTSDSEAIHKLEAESMALQCGGLTCTLADRLARIQDAHAILKERVCAFSAESERIWEELRALHCRLAPFLVEDCNEETVKVERAIATASEERLPRSILKRVHQLWRRIEQDRSESVSGSVLLIGRLWDLLETEPAERFILDSEDISLTNMDRLLEERRRLVDFQQQRFRELYDSHLAELKRLMKALKMGPRQQASMLETVQEYTAEGLQLLSRHLAVLQPKLELTTALYESIRNRDALIAQMRTFEVSASDPARLFRSSFQLMQEEKFRKTALPNLLALEAKLKLQLTEYRDKFREDFVAEEAKGPFASVLEDEIAGRYLNEGIFGFDQAKSRKERSAANPSNNLTLSTSSNATSSVTPRYAKSNGPGTSNSTRKIASIGTTLPQRRPASSRLDK